MSRYSYQRLEPISEEITPTDHQILCLGGTSYNLERLPSRLQRAKQASPGMSCRLEELVYEMSYLKAELQWHKETKQILLQFQENMVDIFTSMENALSASTARLHESEYQYIMLWKASKANEPGGRI